ncbi:hypothetical protein O3G_MSEX004109 [Manduca sexta]|uniref:Spaetzle domain-containing protein n=2 Tax=Manduca sexta TaxID=7130 RepID=A0A922CGC6_MANSE|nr:hypothetical protein O3G_MSEX004109 [Manduca sexta]
MAAMAEIRLGKSQGSRTTLSLHRVPREGNVVALLNTVCENISTIMDRFTLAAVVATVVLFQSSSNFATPLLRDVSMPEECANKNFCTHKHEDYPEELIEGLLKDIEKYLDHPPEFVSRRIALNDLDTNDECDSSSHTLPIYQIRDNNNKTRFVVQSEEKFKQIIRIEECKEPGRLTRATRNLAELVVNDTQLMCVECKLDYKFLVLGLNRTSLEAVNVQGGLPVGCSCKLQE